MRVRGTHSHESFHFGVYAAWANTTTYKLLSLETLVTGKHEIHYIKKTDKKTIPFCVLLYVSHKEQKLIYNAKLYI